jgi:tRNA(Ile)-lysidine synthase
VPEELALAALAAVLTTISGGDYPPRRERLERLFQLLPERLGSGRTLAGCVIRPYRGKLLIAREAAAMAPPVRVPDGGATRWDGRFDVRIEFPSPCELWLGALGDDLPLIRSEIQGSSAIPAIVRPTLAAFRNAKGVVAVPALRYFVPWLREARTTRLGTVFRPTRPLTGAGFRIV